MLGKEKALELLLRALARSRADQTEVSLTGYESALTRFANSQIHQNVAERNAYLAVRCAIGKKIGSAATNILEPESIRRTVEQAHEIAGFQIENPEFASFPKGPFTYRPTDSYVAETHLLTPADRARAVAAIISAIQEKGLRAFGSYSNGGSELAIANSQGVRAYALASDVSCNVVAVGETSSGYCVGASRRKSGLDPEAIARQAIEKALLGRNPTDLEPGTYPVILEPLAASELAEFLCWMGFNAKAVQEGRSFLVGKLGAKIVDEKLSLWDDAYDASGLAFPFDAEGVPKQKVTMIEQGTAKAVVYDSLTAGKENRQSTGHATGYGPAPANIVFGPGATSLDRMIAECPKGVLVSRFHYTNVIDSMKTIITGMTRDGTFLIENGRISRPVKNLRFTQSVLAALSNILGISQELTLIGGGSGYGGRFATGTLAPALHLAEFTFSGKTEF